MDNEGSSTKDLLTSAAVQFVIAVAIAYTAPKLVEKWYDRKLRKAQTPVEQ